MSDEWKGLLYHDEKIIWQGSPEGRVRLEWKSAFTPIFFLFFTGFAIFWMMTASWMIGEADGAGPGIQGPFRYMWVFGLPFFAAGFYNLVLIHFWKARERRRTHYTLTNQRAFIGKTGITGKRSLTSHPITADTNLTISEGATSDVSFAKETKKNADGDPYVISIGFEDLANGREVYALMRKLQDGRL